MDQGNDECEAVLNSQMKGSVHYIIFHMQPQLLSGFEVLQLTYYMLSWAI